MTMIMETMTMTMTMTMTKYYYTIPDLFLSTFFVLPFLTSFIISCTVLYHYCT